MRMHRLLTTTSLRLPGCLLKAVGLDRADAAAFLETDELVDEVWRSFGDTIHVKDIHAIPLFVFNVPVIDATGGPFRSPGRYEAYVIQVSVFGFTLIIEPILLTGMPTVLVHRVRRTSSTS